MSKITSKGQVTIPKEIRVKFGFVRGDEIEFCIIDGRVVVQKKPLKTKLEKWRGVLSLDTDVDDFIQEMRGK